MQPSTPTSLARELFLIFCVFAILRVPECAEGVFLVNFPCFWPKIALSVHIGTHKIPKTQSLKKATVELQYWSQGTCIPIFRLIGPFSQDQIDFLPKFFFQNVPAKIEKNAVFRPINDEKQAKFFKILEFDKNHINASYLQILGHLDHFLAKYDNFWPFLARFDPIII